MGWFWTASSPSKDASSPSTAGTAPSASSATPAPPPANREPFSEDREIQKFWEMIQQEAQPEQPRPIARTAAPPAPSPPTTTTPPPPSSWLSWGRTPSPAAQEEKEAPPAGTPPASAARRGSRSPESLAMSEALLPTTMSCRDAFDYAWHCHTPGAQWNAVYRYGSVRSCSELWDDFWFCMRTKSYGPEQKAAAIRAHYREKEETKYGGGNPSSEDVWETRTELVAPGTAFQAKFEPPIRNDAEFQKAELERRRKIREQLGIEGDQRR